MNKNGTVVWKCRNKSKCTSSCLTDELGVFIREPTTHNHDMVNGWATAEVIINNMRKRSREEFFLRRRFVSTKQIYKKSYIHYQTHYVQKERKKRKKETRSIKRRKRKKLG